MGTRRTRKRGIGKRRNRINGEAKVFRGLAARANDLTLDCPDMQFPIKDCSREMANPMNGPLGRQKKGGEVLGGS